jgi:hypothetical protein
MSPTDAVTALKAALAATTDTDVSLDGRAVLAACEGCPQDHDFVKQLLPLARAACPTVGTPKVMRLPRGHVETLMGLVPSA